VQNSNKLIEVWQSLYYTTSTLVNAQCDHLAPK